MGGAGGSLHSRHHWPACRGSWPFDGGVVSAQLARAYPDLVKALVLVNSSGAQLQARPLSLIDRPMLDAIGAPLIGETLAGVFGNRWGVRQGLLSAYHRKECVTPELVETFSGPLRRYGAGSYLKVSREFANLVLDLTPGEIQAPTLLIWGRKTSRFRRPMPRSLRNG